MKLLHILQIATIIGFLLSLLVIGDRIFFHRSYETKIVDIDRGMTIGGSHSGYSKVHTHYDVHMQNYSSFAIEVEDYNLFNRGDRVKILKSCILKKNIFLQNLTTGKSVTTANGLYSVLFVVPIILLISCILGIWRWNNLKWLSNTASIVIFMTLMTLFMIIS